MKFLEKQLSNDDLRLHMEMLQNQASISASDVNGIITYVNDRFCIDCGYSREELVGQSHHILSSDMHDKEFYRQLWETMSSGQTWRGTFCNARKDGSLFWAKTTITPYRDKQGNIYRYISIRTDITDQVESSVLAESINQRLDHIVSHINVGIIVISSDEQVSMINRHLMQLLALDRDILSGKPLQSLTNFNLVIEILPFLKQHHRQPLAELKPIIEVIIGDRRAWLEVGFQSLFDDQQNLELTLITITDVTEVHQQSITLKHNQQRFDLSQQIARNGTWEWDMRTNEIYWSAGVAPLFGYQSGELETSYENFIKAVHPEDRDTVQNAIKVCLEKNVPYYVEHRVTWPDGQIHWMLETGNVDRDTSGNPVRMLGVVQQIDHRRQIQERLTRQRDINAMLRIATLKILTPNSEQTAVIQEMMRQMLTNLLAESAFFDSADAPGIRDHISPHPLWMTLQQSTPLDVDSIPIDKSHRQLFDNWCRSQNQAVIIHDFGQALRLPAFFRDFGWNNFYFYPLIFADRDLGYFGFINLSLDSTNEIHETIEQFHITMTALMEYIHLSQLEKQSRAELLASRQVAEKANNAKTEFLASVSHELRTPLNAILGFSELLLKTDSIIEIDKLNIEKIFHAGNHLLSLINEMLDLTQIETGHMVLRLEKIKLPDLVDQCISITHPMADKQKVTIDRAAFEYIVKADYTRLKQVIINLINNAIKYNRPDGLVIIKASCENASEVRIDVEDTGLGIEAQNLKKIFEPFERLQHQQSQIEGTGIGLVVTRQLVEKMGGRISVSSQPGIGSVFSIWIPLETEEFTLASSRNEGMLLNDSGESEPIDTELRILLVEDNSFNIELVEKQLNMLGVHDLLLAEDGKEGLLKWRQHQPDMVLSDINMPRMNGFEMLEAMLAEQAQDSHCKVIAMTANAMPDEMNKILEAGFHDYISKPIALEDLRRAIVTNQRGLSKHSVAPASPKTSNDKETTGNFDPGVLRSYIGDDPATEKLLLNTFLQTAPKTLSQARDALQAKRLEEVRKAAHKLKSSVHAIGVATLSEAVTIMEKAATDGHHEEARQAYDTAEQLLQQVSSQIRDYLGMAQD